MTILSRLNGWQRLFVLFAVVVYAPFVFFTVAPLKADNPTAEEVVNGLPSNIRSMVTSGELSIKYEPRPLDGRHWEDAGVAAYQYIVPTYNDLFEYTLAFNKKADHPATYYAIKDKVAETISSLRTRAKLIESAIVAALSLIPLAILYAIGAMGGWVIRGFRKTEAK